MAEHEVNKDETLNTPAPEGGEKKGKSFSLHLSEDRCKLLISGTLPEKGLAQLAADVWTELSQLGRISDETLEKRLPQILQEKIGANTTFSDLVVLESTPPTPPVHGRVEWAKDFFKTGFEMDEETGTVDYRRRAAHRSVGKDELLATVYPPIEGKPGVDVFGKAIKAEKARLARLRKGNNVRYDEDEQKYYAAKNGRIRCVEGTIAVDDVYSISGSVNLETGHIDHPGAVQISQNVETGSIVKASGDIDVQGGIEEAEVICGGNLYVHGGVSGGGRCKITVAGTIHATFIQNADIFAGEDIIVAREIDQAQIKTRGFVRVDSGRIVGGEILALGGIEADQLGSEAFVRTHLIAGKDYQLREKLAPLEQELHKDEEELQRICQRLEPFKARGKNLPPRLRETVTELVTQAHELQTRIAELHDEIEATRQESKERTKKEILARKIIYTDTFLDIPPVHLLLKETVEGPVKAIFKEGKLRLMKTRVRR